MEGGVGVRVVFGGRGWAWGSSWGGFGLRGMCGKPDKLATSQAKGQGQFDRPARNSGGKETRREG